MNRSAAILLVLAACSTPGILTPATGAGTSFPCGVQGTVCLTPAGRPSGFCCPSENVCGGQQPDTFQSCPENACCFVGPGVGDLATRAPTKQTKADVRQ